MFERISVELTNQCSKGCNFCYNGSRPGGETLWAPTEVVEFVRDCAQHGVKAVSFGGGEPLEFEGLFDVLDELNGILFRSVTTNGLLLDKGAFEPLVAAKPDKVHVSLHFSQNATELGRVVRQVLALENAGIASGVNLLVPRSQLLAAHRAAKVLVDAGLSAQQIVYLPKRGCDTPSPEEVAHVAATVAFQSMTCLSECGPSHRFCSIRWDKTVAWCSYTETRRSLPTLTYAGLCTAMSGIGLRSCDSTLIQLEPIEAARASQVVSIGSQESLGTVPVDFPAAHSMDTEWFATDGDGNVALLETGEPGLMPKVLGDTHGSAAYWDLVDNELLTRDSTLPYYLNDFFELGEGKVLRATDWESPRDTSLEKRITSIGELTQITNEEVGKKTPGFFTKLTQFRLGQPPRSSQTWHELEIDAVCWLRDASVLKQLPTTTHLLTVGDKVAAWVRGCPAKLLRRLFDERLILGVMVEEYVPAAHRYGFYVYECNDYNEGPYDRVAVPARPIKLEKLPPIARAAAQRVRLEAILFSQTEKLQPSDYVPCFGWGEDWRSE